jgi:hypothetical protein
MFPFCLLPVAWRLALSELIERNEADGLFQ